MSRFKSRLAALAVVVITTVSLPLMAITPADAASRQYVACASDRNNSAFLGLAWGKVAVYHYDKYYAVICYSDRSDDMYRYDGNHWTFVGTNVGASIGAAVGSEIGSSTHAHAGSTRIS